MIRRFSLLPGAFLGVFLAFSVQAGTAFTLGVLPNHSAHTLATSYEPLRAYLERQLKQAVRIESAVDFTRFHQRSQRGDFDLTLTAAHLARLAQKDAGFQPLVQFTPDHTALLVGASDGSITSVNQLRGRQLAVVDRQAVTVMAALSHLARQDLQAGRDFRVVEHRSHASAAYSLNTGLSAAIITTRQGMLQIPVELRTKLVVLQQITEIPALVFMAGPTLPATRALHLKKLLLDFQQEPTGVEFLQQVGYRSLVEADETRMKRVDIHLKAARGTLAP
jgi:phosphonate transport system substrate-binding protein